MAAQVFWAVFYSSQRPSKIRSIADFDNTAIPLPIFSMVDNQICSEKLIAINENSFNFRICMIPKRLHKNARGYCFFLKGYYHVSSLWLIPLIFLCENKVLQRGDIPTTMNPLVSLFCSNMETSLGL